MSSRSEIGLEALTRADLIQIESACDRFEAAWRQDERPDLATFLADVPGPSRARLFRGLLAIEVECRLGHDEAPEPQAYLDLFPEFAAIIPAVFAGFSQGEVPVAEPGPGSEGPKTLAASPGPDTHFGEVLPRAELSSAVIETLRSAGYEIHGELGRGGMGVVYLARKVALNRPCALKMILAGPHAGSAAAARFRTEAETVARLHHPGIVQIYHVGEAGGLPFLELEYLPGGSLDRALDGTPWPAAQAVRLVEALVVAIAEAHDKGIVHRDLKPANILLDADRSPKVADFGLAKILDSDSDLTRTQTVLGSPSYMAPEQAEGRSHMAGAATDVYALGAILYTLVNEVQDKLGKGSATRAVRQSLLDTAISGLAELAKEDDSFAPNLGRAVAHLKLGEVYRQVGRVPEARTEFERRSPSAGRGWRPIPTNPTRCRFRPRSITWPGSNRRNTTCKWPGVSGQSRARSFPASPRPIPKTLTSSSG